MNGKSFRLRFGKRHFVFGLFDDFEGFFQVHVAGIDGSIVFAFHLYTDFKSRFDTIELSEETHTHNDLERNERQSSVPLPLWPVEFYS